MIFLASPVRSAAPALLPQGGGSIATLILIFVQHAADRLQQFVSG